MSNTSLVAGLAAGAAWSTANLWCLTRLLRAWLGPQPSTRRAIAWSHHPPGFAASEPPQRGSPSANWQVVGWLLVKFPLLYGTAVGLLWARAVSLIGFSLGFSLVLLAALVRFAYSAQRMTLSRSHGR